MYSLQFKQVVVATGVLLTALPVAASLAADGAAQPLLEAASFRDAEATAADALTTAVVVATEPVTLLSPLSRRKAKSVRGDRFMAVSATGSNDVPEAALRAYRNAGSSLQASRPGCELSWTLVAAIGRVESDHGRYGGSALGIDGVSRPAIVGLQLNGAGPVAAIRDTDAGKLDGDKVWDRAVGQMQFIPSTWRMVASDGDGDGQASPNDIDDAALAAGRYLCLGGFSVGNPSGMARAVYSYNHSDYYVALVMAFQRGYETGVFVLPSPPAPPGADDGLPAPASAKSVKKPQPKPVAGIHKGTSGSGSVSKPAPGGVKKPPPPPPSPSAPSPTPSPSPVPLTFSTGPFSACGDTYCLGGQKLGLGPDSQLARHAAHDYDSDGSTETNADEFTGLAESAADVRLGYQLVDGVAVVYVVGDKNYRFADGSFA